MDNKGTRCTTKWCRGIFDERSIHDDWDGTVRCEKCGKIVKRYKDTKVNK